MKKLNLRKELLTELSADELNFAGAHAAITTICGGCGPAITYSCVTACGGNSCFCSIGAQCTNTCGCGDVFTALLCL